jgi:hypothetical protein
MGKSGGQVKYVTQRKISRKPVKSTRIRNKKVVESVDTTDKQILGVVLYALSVLCLVGVIMICK